jgi:hypothetical protein
LWQFPENRSHTIGDAEPSVKGGGHVPACQRATLAPLWMQQEEQTDRQLVNAALDSLSVLGK